MNAHCGILFTSDKLILAKPTNQTRIFIFVERLAPQGRGPGATNAVAFLCLTYRKVGLNSENSRLIKSLYCI